MYRAYEIRGRQKHMQINLEAVESSYPNEALLGPLISQVLPHERRQISMRGREQACPGTVYEVQNLSPNNSVKDLIGLQTTCKHEPEVSLVSRKRQKLSGSGDNQLHLIRYQ